VQSYLSRRFGDKRVSHDPSDPEANKLAVSQGYTVVHGGMMSSAAWQNAKSANAIQPAGQVRIKFLSCFEMATFGWIT